MSKIKDISGDQEKRKIQRLKRKKAQAREKMTAEMMRMPTPEDRDALLLHVDALLGLATDIAPILKHYRVDHFSAEHVIASILDELNVDADLDISSCLWDIEAAYSERQSAQSRARTGT